MQKFLLSPAARDLSLAQLYDLTEGQAYDEFLRLRYAETGGNPVCPKCGSTASVKFRCRPILKCKECFSQFSPTSGTVFAYRKLSFKKILLGIAYFSKKSNGKCALDLCDDLNVHYRTAYLLGLKLRVVMGRVVEAVQLEGAVAIDGTPVGGHIRPKNVKKKKTDHRKFPYRNSRKGIVIGAIREKFGERRSKSYVLSHENKLLDKVYQQIPAGEEVHHDAAAFYNELALEYETKVINHSVQYSSPDACTNIVESHFSQLKAANSAYRSIVRAYPILYARENDWRANMAKKPKRYRFEELIRHLGTGRSGFGGYQQGTQTNEFGF